MEAEASGNASPMEVEASEQAPPPIFSLSLLQFVKKEQAQNGVKHGEFARYRCVLWLLAPVCLIGEP